MSHFCNRCGRPISNKKSVERGYGPVCWGKIHTSAKDNLEQKPLNVERDAYGREPEKEEDVLKCVRCGHPAIGFYNGEPMCGPCKRNLQYLDEVE